MDALSHRRLKNREKQTALRQRRKDYVKLLESRLSELEKPGVQATEKVQVAARQVDAENALLRRFIADRLGHRALEGIDREVGYHQESNPPHFQSIKRIETVSVATQTDEQRSEPLHSITSRTTMGLTERNRSQSPPHPTTSTVPCASAFRMIHSVNFKGKDMAEIIVQLSPGFSVSAYDIGCCEGNGQKKACSREGKSCTEIDCSNSSEGSGCVVDSRILFKVLDDISEI